MRDACRALAQRNLGSDRRTPRHGATGSLSTHSGESRDQTLSGAGTKEAESKHGGEGWAVPRAGSLSLAGLTQAGQGSRKLSGAQLSCSRPTDGCQGRVKCHREPVTVAETLFQKFF